MFNTTWTIEQPMNQKQRVLILDYKVAELLIIYIQAKATIFLEINSIRLIVGDLKSLIKLLAKLALV